jgi:hypothetical protein
VFVRRQISPASFESANISIPLGSYLFVYRLENTAYIGNMMTRMLIPDLGVYSTNASTPGFEHPGRAADCITTTTTTYITSVTP